MVYNHGSKPYEQMDDLGGKTTPIFGSTPISSKIELKSNPPEPGSDFENVLEHFPFRPHSRLAVCPIWEDELERHLGILGGHLAGLAVLGILGKFGLQGGPLLATNGGPCHSIGPCFTVRNHHPTYQANPFIFGYL